MKEENSSIGIDFDNNDMQVRLIVDSNSEIMTMGQAKEIAEQRNLDLILINNSDIPVLKVGDYSRFEYERKKKQRDSSKHKDNIKEIRIRCNIAEHDMKVRAKQIDNFLKDGYKIVVTIIFKGRNVAHIHERGQDVVDKLLNSLTEEYMTVRGTSVNRNNVTITISKKSSGGK